MVKSTGEINLFLDAFKEAIGYDSLKKEVKEYIDRTLMIVNDVSLTDFIKNAKEIDRVLDTKIDFDILLSKTRNTENKDLKKLNLRYNTEHLPYFFQLREACLLEGDEYIPFVKGAWYCLCSGAVKTTIKNVSIGKLRTDTRLHLLFILPSGAGKNNLGCLIKEIFEKIQLKGDNPTCLHPERLIGKINNRGTITKPKWLKNYGYLSRDFIILNEIHSLLTSKDLNLQDSRKNLRIAKDPFPNNRIEKKSVDNTFDSEEVISYTPEILVVSFTQPQSLPQDIVEDGDFRRDLIMYIPMFSFRDKEKEYSNRLIKIDNSKKSVEDFSLFLKLIISEISGKSFVFEDKAVQKFIELHKILVEYGKQHSRKCANFTGMIDFSLQDFLAKMSCILAAAHRTTKITEDFVILAFIDLLEFFDMQLKFIFDKIYGGNLDYGEGWQGSGGTDKKCLEYLLSNGAVTLEKSNITGVDFKEKIQKIKNCGPDAAEKHFQRFKRLEWIGFKQGFQKSTVWLLFEPAEISIKTEKSIDVIAEYEKIVDTIPSILRGLPPLLPLRPCEEEIKGNNDSKGIPPLPPLQSFTVEEKFLVALQELKSGIHTEDAIEIFKIDDNLISKLKQSGDIFEPRKGLLMVTQK